MAVEKVTATLLNDTEQLTEEENSIYQGELTSPTTSGDYGITITAYDDGGNVSVADSSTNRSLLLDVTWWKEPKTNWKSTDRFNIEDYNRIKNNIVYLHETASALWKPFDIEEMGEDITNYTSYWNVDVFNMFESNLETINKNMFTKDYGYSQQFFNNGPFIKWDELNRIESAILSMKQILDNQKASIRRLSFRLGTYKKGRL